MKVILHEFTNVAELRDTTDLLKCFKGVGHRFIYYTQNDAADEKYLLYL